MANVGDSGKIKVSVIVCAFNEEKRISDCLESVVNQDYDSERYEIIVMDNESTDRTPEIARHWIAAAGGRPLMRYFRIKHVGLSTSRNTGIHHSRGGIIAFIDGDAKADSSWLGNLIKPFKADPGVAVVAGRIENLNEDSTFARFIHKAHFRAMVVSSKSKVIGANMAFRREVFEETGGFFDYFVSRGDETSVRRYYFQKHPERSEGYAPDAVVYNEHVESLKQWLSQRYSEGRMSAIIQYNILRADSRRAIMAKTAVNSLSVISLPGIILNVVFRGRRLFTFLWGAGLARYTSRYAYFREAYSEVLQNFGIFKAFLGPGTVLLGLVFRDMGRVVESIHWLAGRRIDLGHSMGEIIDSVPR